MKDRAEIERGIRDEEVMLEEVAALLERRSELSTWPDAVRAALALALADDTMSRAEQRKATALRRHLFGGDDSIPHGITAAQPPSITDRRHAEYLRAALVPRVRYRSGTHLRAPAARP